MNVDEMLDKMSELKPCPFCGENPAVVHPSNGLMFIGCNHGIENLGVYVLSKPDTSVLEWNTRPIEDALQAEIDRRDEELALTEKKLCNIDRSARAEVARLNAEIKTTDDLRAEIAQGNVEIALLDKELADLRQAMHALKNKNAELSRFVWWVYQVYARNVQELTSGITEACTYETEEKAEKGKYGLPIRCWEYIRYLEEYTAGIYNGTYLDSETSTGVKRDLSDAEINELGAQEAEKRGEK